ncbi:PepSY-associated TM helix domain-containing protein [Gimesia sp.]|uniref:PepSY-associated TM helix domain-containing protein n=1 Tax=Gimesia sp. TaxID=2024833 RepID=UPI003A9487F1
MLNQRLRRLWVITHRWLGLTAGLLFVLIGLTGSLLVFHRTIDEWLNPQILVSAGNGASRTVDEVLQAAEQSLTDANLQLFFAEPPRTELGVWTVWFRNTSDKTAGFTQVYVDPSSAEVTGQRVWGEYFVTWMYSLHYKLLSGRTGEIIVGLCGLILMVSVASGVYLWWPLWRHSWRAAFAIRSGRRFQYDLHKSTGVIAALLLLVVSFTGVYMIFPEWVRPCVLAVLDDGEPRSENKNSNPVSGGKRIDVSQATAVAQSVFPDAEFKRVKLPSKPKDAFEVRLRQAGEVRKSSGNSRVWIDQYSGEVLSVRDSNQRSAADAFFAWQFPLHNGEAFGLVGRWIVFVSGLMPAVLYVTGFLVWWRRRRTHRSQTPVQLELQETK